MEARNVAVAGERPGLGVFTLPNAITLVRLGCLPIFLYLLFGRDDRGAAALLLGGIGATDWIDGYLARRLGQISTLGKVLDPTADRVVFFVGAIAMLADGSVPVGFAALTLVREAVVAGAVLVLAARGARRMDVTYVGKCATAGLMVAFPLFLYGVGTMVLHDAARVAAWLVGVPSLALSYYAAYAYVPIAKAAMADQSIR